MSEESKAEYRKKGNARGCISSGVLTVIGGEEGGREARGVYIEGFLHVAAGSLQRVDALKRHR